MPVPVSGGRVREGGGIENGIKEGEGGVVDVGEKEVPILLFC